MVAPISNSQLKNAVLAFFNLAKRRAKLAAARKTSVFKTLVLTSHPCDDAVRAFQRAANRADVNLGLALIVMARCRCCR